MKQTTTGKTTAAAAWLSTAATLVLSAGAPASAQATRIELNDLGGLVGTPAGVDFQVAAAFWGSVLTNPVTVRIDAGFTPMGPKIIGGTDAAYTVQGIRTVEQRLVANAATPLDNQATSHLPQVHPGGTGVDVIQPGFLDAAAGAGIDTTRRVFDANDTANNSAVLLTSANAKALGLPGGGGTADAQILFNSDFASRYEFNPTNGVSGRIDFLAAALHEMGHALGFTSGAQTYDFAGAPKGPDGGLAGVQVERYVWAEGLDLFRYSANAAGLGGGGPKLDWSPGAASYFSVDGGATPFLGGYFSTGFYNGDGAQASHWKDQPCGAALGVMHPVNCPTAEIKVTALDLAALDAIGWNTSYDVLANPSLAFTTSFIYSAYGGNVPEPSTLALIAVCLLPLAAWRGSRSPG